MRVKVAAFLILAILKCRTSLLTFLATGYTTVNVPGGGN